MPRFLGGVVSLHQLFKTGVDYHTYLTLIPKLGRYDNPQGEHQVPKPPPVTRSISNKERGGPRERTLSKRIPPKEKLTSQTYPPK